VKKRNEKGSDAPTGVLLLGWGGARKYQLTAIADWYRGQGLAPTVHIPDISILFNPPKGYADLAALARKVENLEGRFIVHLFSNNGFIAYCWLLEQVGTQAMNDFRERVVGQVFDSSPGLPEEISAARYSHIFADGFQRALEAEGRGRWVLAFSSVALPIFFRTHYYLHWKVRRHIVASRTRYNEYAPDVPTLVVYSHSDLVVKHESVREFIEDERARGREAEVLICDGSAHVAHLKNCRQQYLEKIKKLIER
jgi:pimeloyl-ACP methyl ester carboxylesterase